MVGKICEKGRSRAGSERERELWTVRVMSWESKKMWQEHRQGRKEKRWNESVHRSNARSSTTVVLGFFSAWSSSKLRSSTFGFFSNSTSTVAARARRQHTAAAMQSRQEPFKNYITLCVRYFLRPSLPSHLFTMFNCPRQKIISRSCNPLRTNWTMAWHTVLTYNFTTMSVVYYTYINVNIYWQHIKAKFHYAGLFRAGSKPVRS